MSVANVQYQHEYQQFLDGVKLLDVDLGWMRSASCVVGIDFHDRLLFATIDPIAVIMLLGIAYESTILRGNSKCPTETPFRGAPADILRTHQCQLTLFQTFSCEHLEDEKPYLWADYRIECDSTKHEKLQVYAVIMIIIYTLGIPALYATLSFKNHEILKSDETSRNNALVFFQQAACGSRISRQ